MRKLRHLLICLSTTIRSLGTGSAGSMSGASAAVARYEPLQIGLTGSIGMGKSAIARQFRSLGFPVFDADAAVHELYSAGGQAVPLIQAAFPDSMVVVEGAVSRPLLSRLVLQDADALRRLEAIVHPLVKAEREAFLAIAASRGAFLVLYDVPLLFENPHAQAVDYAIVASAQVDTQRRRVLARPLMTLEKFEAILAKQVRGRARGRGKGNGSSITRMIYILACSPP